jgi:glutathione S-transferase
MATASPFVRKVRLAAAERGLLDQLENVHTNPHERDADLVAANPLSRVPTLVTDDGQVHCDSLAICLFLDTIGDYPPLLPPASDDRSAMFLRHAWADGATEALVGCRVESLKPEEAARTATIERYKATVGRVFDQFEAIADEIANTLSIDTLALAAVLTYSDFRFAEDDWRAGRPKLAAWLKEFSQRPSMRLTELSA